MKNRVLIIKFITWEGPGLFRDVLQEHKIPADVIEIDRGEAIPSVLSYGAVLMMGGPPSANDVTPMMRMALTAAHDAVENDIPFFGVCLGHQVLAKTAGGAVRSCVQPEVGFVNEDEDPYGVTLTNEGAADPLFAGLPHSFEVFQLHGEEAVPAPGVPTLATSNGVDAQAIRVGKRAYGLQFHVEVMNEMLAVLSAQLEMLQHISSAELQSDFAERADEYIANGKRIFENFLSIAGLLESVDLTSRIDMRDPKVAEQPL